MDGATQEPRPAGVGVGGRRRRGWALVATIVGAALLGAGVWAVVSQRQAGESALTAARSAPAWLVVAVVLLPLVNWLLTSAVFWVLTGRYARVRPVEMGALIGSAWLLNYIPARAGLLGRVAYHKAVNGIRVRDAAGVIVQSIGCTGVALAALLGVIAGTSATGAPEWVMPAAMLGIALALGTAATIAHRRGPDARWWRLLGAAGLRCADVTVWGVRYLAVFTLAGVAATPLGIGVVTAASQASMLLPIQVGAREWVVGLTSGLTAAGAPSGSGGAESILASAAPGLAADLINRAAETLVAVPVGLWGTWWVVRRLRRAGGGGVGVGGAPGALPPDAEPTDTSE